MATVHALPLFHLYGDPPDDQAFDFIHVETISSRSSVHDWTIRVHRHRNLFQILIIAQGGGLSFTEDVTEALGDHSGEALARLRALAADPVVPIGAAEAQRLSALCSELHEERFLAREGYRYAMRGYLTLIAIEVARLGGGRARPRAGR